MCLTGCRNTSGSGPNIPVDWRWEAGQFVWVCVCVCVYVCACVCMHMIWLQSSECLAKAQFNDQRQIWIMYNESCMSCQGV